MQQNQQEQLAFKQMQKLAEKEEEEAFRKMMMAKFAEDDRIEQMNAQKRRMKQLEHKRAVEKLIEDRRRQHEADMVQTHSLCESPTGGTGAVFLSSCTASTTLLKTINICTFTCYNIQSLPSISLVPQLFITIF